ncbi:MAG: indolepyruvate ferredoxin oxidoreductase family protein [Pseudomonadota bacterium]
MTDQTPILSEYRLDDRYTATQGRVFLTGTQALVRVVLDQARRDREAGLDTRGYVSGYRGSPLGGVDQEMARASAHLEAARITCAPAVNEEFGATQMIGTQQVETDPHKTCAGVFGLWYGKGPGVDRAADALKHGNAYGSSPTGGVLVVAGDDHGCVSSSMPHQSDVAFMNFYMPTLSPADVSDFLRFAEFGYALSRYSGMWVGFKAISEIVESGQSVAIRPDHAFVEPDHIVPPSGLHYRWPDLPGPQIEERMEAKKAATLAFARANPIDRAEWGHPARYGIVTTGKAHGDTLEALRLLGIDQRRAREIGLDLYKIGMVWPMEYTRALAFAADKQELLVIEEKRGIIESQLKEYFYDFPGQKPARMVGKRDEHQERLVPWTHELSPKMLAHIIARRLDLNLGLTLSTRAADLAKTPDLIAVDGAARTPYFCSGCPHNSSTRVPEGSEALAGIGCHFMASWMDRNTTSLIQMGGEGVNWVARSRFNGNRHIFQNLGDGTYHHSGSLAIRQAIAAGTNITYKILYNEAVAMTGGQAVDGPISVEGIAAAVLAEGAARVAVVSDAPEAFVGRLPPGVSLHSRRSLDAVQRELREVPGVTVLIYQQVCATEKRRLRKRGKLADPKRFAVINPAVCEGCGDCSVASNCLSVEPLETELGRKRQINLASCNKDFSCLEGFCPSFVTVEGAALKKRGPADLGQARDALAKDLAAPDLPGLARPFDLLVTGVGGTGVVTVGQVIAMAAQLEGKSASVLDFMGFAQKFGPVLSYLRIAHTDDALNQVRIDTASADALIGCDLVVSSSPKASAVYARGHTSGVLNSALMPTGDFTRARDADLKPVEREARIAEALGGEDRLHRLDANALAAALLGDPVFANVLMLGAAWQAGLLPLSDAALHRAIELNGVKPEENLQAFLWGRLAVAQPDRVAALAGLIRPEPLSPRGLVSRRAEMLTGYQNEAYARHYRARLEVVMAAETRIAGAPGALSETIAKALYKLMAYKDEYEVARLHTQGGFLDGLQDRFEDGFAVQFHLAPPFLAKGTDSRGRPGKRQFGPWMARAMRGLAALKGLRGTPFDPFGYSAERRMERALIGEYNAKIDMLLQHLSAERLPKAIEIASLALEIRGFGPVKAEAIAKFRADAEAELANYVTK